MSVPKIFGIDLGTTYSAIAYVDEFGQPVVVLNEDDEPVTASSIYFETPDNVVVGKIAKTTGRIDPFNYVELFKPYMGDPDYRRELQGKEYRPEQLSAIILGKLKSYAEAKLGTPVTDVVITVPAYFNEQQRNATEQTGILAGFNVKRIIPEPTAAAIAYAATDAERKTVLVYDLGGGTFDVTVIRIEDQKVRVVCVKGDHNLGGRQWDDCIAAYLASEWQRETGDNDDPLSNQETLQELLNTAEESKKQLSQRVKVPVKVSHNGNGKRVELTREKFDELTSSLLEKTAAMTRDAVTESAHLGAKTIDLILLVGGSSRMPQVQARLEREFPGIEQKVFDPELSVAKGAAIYANSTHIQDLLKDMLDELPGGREGGFEALPAAVQKEIEEKVARALPGTTRDAIAAGMRTQVINVCSKNFGLITLNSSTRADEVFYLIKRNSPVPAEVEEEFFTLEDNQENVLLQVIESSAEVGPTRPLPTDPNDPTCRRLKSITLNLPSGLRAGHPIQVKYSLSEDGGRLRIHAVDKHSSAAIEDSVENLGAIQPQEMESLKREMAGMVYH